MNYRGIIQCCVFAVRDGPAWLKSLRYGVVLIMLLNCTNAFGANITLVTDFLVRMKPEGLALELMTENRGDVPAHDVQLEVIAEDKVLAGPVVKKLDVDEQASVNFTLADVLGIPGRYPVVIRTNYKDANGYPFTALSVGFHDYQSSLTPAVFIRGETIRLPVGGKVRVSFVLRNDGWTAQDIDLALYIPNELSVMHQPSVIELGSQQKRTLEYEVENFSALANSRYQIPLVGQYEKNGKHFSVAGSAVVLLVDDARPAVKPVWIWVLLCGLMPGVIIFQRLKKQWA